MGCGKREKEKEESNSCFQDEGRGVEDMGERQEEKSVCVTYCCLLRWFSFHQQFFIGNTLAGEKAFFLVELN